MGKNREPSKLTQAYGATAAAISLHILGNQEVVCVLCFPVQMLLSQLFGTAHQTRHLYSLPWDKLNVCD